MTSETEIVEASIRKQMEGLNLSRSHDFSHLDRVLAYARGLSEVHGGDPIVITGAALLHDLGRSDHDLHGIDSVNKSIELARPILAKIESVSQQQIESALTAISEHDQADIVPSTVEGKILKDADFLAGFGAWGIYRSAVWTAESSGSITDFYERVGVKMQKRLAGLEFKESKRLAKREMPFARLFTSLMQSDPELEILRQKGTYILLEGIGGSGKNTQGEILIERLHAHNIDAKYIIEPTGIYKEARRLWAEHDDDPWVQAFLFMVDRYNQLKETVQPALERGEIVVSVRSYISTVIYQAKNAQTAKLLDFFHRFMPIPDLTIILDVSETVAYERIQQREETGRIRGQFETEQKLRTFREGYRGIADSRSGENINLIDGSKSIEEVSADIWALVKETCLIQD